jgi:hypothetical protein
LLQQRADFTFKLVVELISECLRELRPGYLYRLSFPQIIRRLRTDGLRLGVGDQNHDFSTPALVPARLLLYPPHAAGP